ncbi:MAG: thioredoxin [Acidimicrobiales bacterium]|nr:thioredoxin [Acidimicrobiales bacterium]
MSGPSVAAVRSTVVACPSCGTKNRVVASSSSGVPRCGQCQTSLPWLADAGDDDFGAVVEESGLPVVVDFWAPWCGPCRMVTPALENLALDHAGQVKLVKVNVDESPRVAGRFGVQSIPTITLMRGSDVVATQIGAVPEPNLRRWLDGALSSPTPAAEGGAPAAGGPVDRASRGSPPQS